MSPSQRADAESRRSCPAKRSAKSRHGRLRPGRPLVGGEKGAALLEFALVATLLLMMVLGVIEFGSMFSDLHTMTSLSREGANLAARGAGLSTVVTNVMTNGADIGLAAQGGVVASRIFVRGGSPDIDEQVASGGFEGKSRLGLAGTPATNVGSWNLQEGQIVYVVEVFYRYDSITPLKDVAGIGVPDTLYERGVF